MKFLKAIFVGLLLTFSYGSTVGAATPINAYLFWGDGCPHCAKEKVYLSEVVADYPSLKLSTFEIYHSQDNVALMQNVAKKLDVNASGVPFLVIGDKSFVGYSEGVTDSEIKEQINKCSISKCPDSVASILKGADADGSEERDAPQEPVVSNGAKKIVSLPIVGEINALDFSLPILTIIIGALDGFNPCAMWVLLFLISLLLGMDNRKKMWIMGLSFIAASAFVYFLFMAAWLNLILFLGLVIWVRLAIGILALIGGGYNIKKGIKDKGGGCDVTGGEKRQAIFGKLRGIVKNKSLLLALLGIVLLAFAVNLVELVCSAGLPAVYTQVLALSDLSTWQYYGYILLYILFFMLDDIVVFAIAMTTLKLTGISTKYSRYSNIIGGVLMVIIGLLLIFKPEWLMFG
jgi:thiol-disulfide isomerase/thioredoxin